MTLDSHSLKYTIGLDTWQDRYNTVLKRKMTWARDTAQRAEVLAVRSQKTPGNFMLMMLSTNSTKTNILTKNSFQIEVEINGYIEKP